MGESIKTVEVRAESTVWIAKAEAATKAWASRKAANYVRSKETYWSGQSWRPLYDEYHVEGDVEDKGEYWKVLVVGTKKLDVPVPPVWVDVKSEVLAGLDSPGE